MNISTSCPVLVIFGPETSEFTLLTIAPFVAIRQKSVYHAKYLRMFWTYLDLLYKFGRRISGDAFTRFNGNNHASSYPNLVIPSPVISKFTLLKRAIFDAIRPQFDDDLHSSRCRFETDWKITILISA